MPRTDPEPIAIPLGPVTLQGDLTIPEGAHGLVLFSHGSGSSRRSPRNRFVAERLQRAGFATLLMDLLTEEEDRTYATRFDIGLLTRRLLGVTRWIGEQPRTAGLPLGYFGASTGAASALWAAAGLGHEIGAVVSRGGRPDLAIDVLDRVAAPTLLIVGGNDFGVIELNQEAYDRLAAVKRLEIVPGATHLFEEPGALEKVADLAADWFARHLAGGEELHAVTSVAPPRKAEAEKPWEIWLN